MQQLSSFANEGNVVLSQFSNPHLPDLQSESAIQGPSAISHGVAEEQHPSTPLVQRGPGKSKREILLF